MGFLSSLSHTPDFALFRRGHNKRPRSSDEEERPAEPSEKQAGAKTMSSSSAWPPSTPTTGESPLTGGGKGGFLHISRFIPRRSNRVGQGSHDAAEDDDDQDSDVERQRHGIFSSADNVEFALGEVAALLPVTGAFVRHAEFLVDPAWGFAVGWNLVYGNLLSIPTELTAICVFFQYWTDAVHPSVYILVFIALTTAVGFAYVRVFGEVEFAFALLKIALVVFLVVFGLVVDLGGVSGVPALYFTYWADPGPFVEFVADGAWGRFLGYWSAMTGAVFSFAGVESIAMAGAETRNPRKAIPAACKNVFIRIVLFYMLSILIVGMLVASNNPDLDDSGSSVAKSPFVLAVAGAGIPAIPNLINAIVITSAWSASNQALLAGTRVLYGLALKRQAPRVFLRTTSWGVPWVCVLLFTLFMFLSFMTFSNDALTVFWWLVSLTSAGVLFSWISILMNHIRLRLAMQKQAIPVSRLPWHNAWTLYTSWIGLVLCIVILLTGGFAVFTKGRWNSMTFVSSYLDIPLVLGAYLIWKLIKGTRLVNLSQVPLHSAFEQAEQKYAALDS
ncbi:hypothetical protein HIM_03593 [Hirsutella minnesotensis 3608]|uniref:Amino acid permease/ SLC12A domain-containing protein n=1 Tax=Hirsutella minnesotensis 3608 TaxID=1043627 RepID=A0A0F8A2U0_9HYPO|nr:hypothetical protein HIM_03593 [Hirsutella minnesotensis 3608]